MPIPQKRNNPQRQPITVLLRNTIRDYPAGGGILRELLQNADDAGATKIEFVLDKRSHEARPLLDPGLDEYSGPAFLSYNNSEFTEKDFQSLSRIGDSLKFDDPESTGKFGRGFNSVYNWTDSPCILSESSLLVLEPHQQWSEGGPLWDFVEHSREPEMRNQLSTFDSILKCFDEKFPGTIIRVPLRTDAHAQKSEIAPKITTSVEDVEQVLTKYCADELVESLLFLRNVRSIVVRVGNTVFAKAEASTTRMNESGNLQSMDERADLFMTPYKDVLVKRETPSWDHSYLMDINTIYESVNQKHTFAISHHMNTGMVVAGEKDTYEWARGLKMFPWAAVATPLKASRERPSRLFNILPLPVQTRHPFHIHGMFSITSDRSKIHTGGDTTASDKAETTLGAQWNEWLFHNCVVPASFSNLVFLRTLAESGVYPGSYEASWQSWPAGCDGSWGEPKTDILKHLLERVLEDNEKLLPTICGTTLASLRSPSDCLYQDSLDGALENALRAAGISVVILPVMERKYSASIQQCLQSRIPALNPQNVRGAINRKPENVDQMGLLDRQVLFNFILGDCNYEDLGRCEGRLVPIKDGSYQAFSKGKRYKFATNDIEARLFVACPERCVDSSKLSEHTKERMITDIRKLSSSTCISEWDIHDATWYCNNYIFDKWSPETVTVYEHAIPKGWINDFWQWTFTRGMPITSTIPTIGQLWVLPVMNNGYRKLIISDDCQTLDISGNSNMASFLRGIANSPHSSGSWITSMFQRNAKPMISPQLEYSFYIGDNVSAAVTLVFRGIPGVLVDCSKLQGLARWLVKNRKSFLEKLKDNERTKFIHEINRSFEVADRNQIKEISSLLRGLPLFKELSQTSTWTSVNESNITYIATRSDNVPFEIRGSVPSTVFINIDHEEQLKLVQNLNSGGVHVQIYELRDLLRFVIMPELKLEPPNEKLCEFALEKDLHLDIEEQKILARAKFVPTEGGLVRRSPHEVIIPKSKIASLYFEDEVDIIGDVKFTTRFQYNLKRLARIMHTATAQQELIINRIHTYSVRVASSIKPEGYDEKLRSLFSHTVPIEEFPEETLRQKWIPAKYIDKDSLQICSAQECRDKTFKYAVDRVLGITNLEMGDKWRTCLGWTTDIHPDVLHDQLKKLVDAKCSDQIKLMITKGNLGPIFPRLEDTAWIPGDHGYYFRPADVFMEKGSYTPYLGTLDPDFKWILRGYSKIQKSPSFQKLNDIQESFSSNKTLTANDLKVAVLILNTVAKEFLSEDAMDGSFKAPDRDGRMQVLNDLTAGHTDNVTQKHLKFLHQDVPYGTCEALKILTVQDRFIQELDKDPDDFAQMEDISVMIKDTLRRYPRESAFNEYLANAEDSGTATKIRWIVDEAESGNENLMNEKLRDTQGKALFSYNDGVFSNGDFKALTNIGVGSKAEKNSKLGRFGRGALTMYHFSSVPSLISGPWFIMFDPKMERLPLSPATNKPRAGIKLSIKDVRNNFPAHLLPFEGLDCGFDKDTIDYKGTLFRFPILNGNSLSNVQSLQTSSSLVQDLQAYFDLAKSSLLFLNKIDKIEVYQRSTARVLKPIWKISAERSTQDNTVQQLKIRSLNYHLPLAYHRSKANVEESTATWILKRTIEEQHNLPGKYKGLCSAYRLQPRYGVAVMVSKPALVNRIYVDIPLRGHAIEDLPFSFSAELIMQSNRQGVAIEATDKSPEANWNRWICSQVIRLYQSLLEEVMQRSEFNGYKYWPSPPNFAAEDVKTISEYLATEFWNQIPECQNLLYPFASSTSVGSPENSTSTTILRLDDVMFDFLDSNTSDVFCGFLQSLGYKTIRPRGPALDGLLAYHSSSVIKSDESTTMLKTITPTLLRSVLSSEFYASEFCKLFNDDSDFSKAGNVLLGYLLSDDPDLDAIEGFYAVPLKNHSLGLLASKGNNFACKFLVLSSTKRPYDKLLHNRPDLELSSNVSISLKNKLLKNYNVEEFSFIHISKILGESDIKITEYLESLHHLWETFNIALNNLEILDIDANKTMTNFGTIPVHAISQTSDEVIHHSYCTVAEFSDLSKPIILQQTDPNALKFIRCLNGVWILDRKTYPTSSSLFVGEMITEPRGLSRLLSSIKILASHKGQSISSYLEEAFLKYLSQGGQMEQLTVIFTTANWESISSFGTYQTEDLRSILKQIPIWRVKTAAGQETWRSAKDILLAPDTKFDWSSASDKPVFLNSSWQQRYKKQMAFLRVGAVTIQKYLSTYLIARSNNQLPLENLSTYVSFVKNFRNEHETLNKNAIVIDGHRNFRFLKDLYDHKDSVFQAAFRHKENSYFLHPKLRGFNIEPTFQELHYNKAVVCAQEIHNRSLSEQASDQLYQDATKVYNAINNAVQSLTTQRGGVLANRDLNRLWSLRFVPTSRPNDLNSYRTSTMLQLLPNVPLTSLANGIRPKDISVAWSQRPIFARNPSCQPFKDRVKQQTRDIVLQHLIYVSSKRSDLKDSQLSEFIDDVTECYKFIQKHNITVSETLRVWLNIEATGLHSANEVQESWKPARELVLSLQDESARSSLTRSPVKGFLKPFKGMLERSGVKKEKPLPPIANAPTSDSHFESLLSQFQVFRRDGKYFDFKLVLDDLKEIQAHRALLAAASSYFRAMLDINMSEARSGVCQLSEISYNTALRVIDYIYSGEMTTINCGGVQQDMDELLSLLEAANRYNLPGLTHKVEGVLCSDVYVQLDTARDILRDAIDYRATRLEEACRKYIFQNEAEGIF